MKTIFSFMVDELKNIIKDSGLILILVAGVIAYAFCYAYTYQYEVIQEIPVGVINLDGTNFSREFIRHVDAGNSINVTMDFLSQQDAETEFNEGKIKAFILIPKNFERDLLRGKQVNISFYGDNSNLIVYKTVYSSLIETTSDMAEKIETGELLTYGLSKKQATNFKNAFEFIPIPLFNPANGYQSYLYPIILILIFHQTLILAIGMRQGTRNEKKEKFSKNAVDIPLEIFARMSVYIALYTIYAAIGFLIFPQLFKYPMYYNLIPLSIVYILMMYAAAFFAQAISYFFKIRETVLLILIPCSIIFIFMSGLIWPREAIPQIINTIFFFIPATCGIDGIIKINQNGAGFFNIIYDILWLLFLCFTYYLLAVFTTKQMDKNTENGDK